MNVAKKWNEMKSQTLVQISKTEIIQEKEISIRMQLLKFGNG